MSTEEPAGPEASGNGRGDRVEALRLEYEYVRDENIRLRDGRASLTRQLGPLPISAAIVAGLVTGFTNTDHNDVVLAIALVLFGVLVVISILYSSMKPYRVLRAEKERDFRPRTESPERWYENAMELEKAIYGRPSDDKGLWKGLRKGLREGRWEELRKELRARRPTRDITSLQDGYDRERFGLFVVQGLFALVIILLIVSRVT